MLLYQARLLVEEGRYDAALIVLETMGSAQRQQRDVAYLLGWCYVQRKQWEDACNVLRPLLGSKEAQLTIDNPQAREWHALALLFLGLSAAKLAIYEDASLHLAHCLKVLHDRRVHLPQARIHARYALAVTCLIRGLYSQAIQHYEEALRLCRHYNDDEVVPDIHSGLCDVYRHLGDLNRAYMAGQEALQLYKARQDLPMIARMHHMLGCVFMLLRDYQEAEEHYTQALAIAIRADGTTMTIVNYAALAEVYMEQACLEQARHYCQLALQVMEQTCNIHMFGHVYYIIGKVNHQSALRTSGVEHQKLLDCAIAWYNKANTCLETTQTYGDCAELYTVWAQALEELGRVEEAIECYRAGFNVLHESKMVMHALELS
jgi:tetratricopeptide (TPR) repeat protein